MPGPGYFVKRPHETSRGSTVCFLTSIEGKILSVRIIALTHMSQVEMQMLMEPTKDTSFGKRTI